MTRSELEAGQAAYDLRVEWYRIIAEHTSDTIVLVDNEAVVRYVSPAFHGMFGYTVDQYEGFDAFDVIHPDDREQVRHVFQVVLADKTQEHLGYRVFHADG